MKFYCFLGKTFFNWNIAIFNEIKKDYPSSEMFGIVAARKDLFDEIKSRKDLRNENFDWLNSLEEKWLSTPLDYSKLKKYEEMLGASVLRRIIIADRELGVGFVSGGFVEGTKLIDLTKYNNEKRWSYVVGLLDYFFETFEKTCPDVVFTYATAGAVTLAMYEVAKVMNILFLQPVHPRIGENFVLDNNALHKLSYVKNTFEKSLKDKKEIESFLPEAQVFLEKFRSNPVLPTYQKAYNKNALKASKIHSMIYTFCVDIARMIAIKLGLFGTRNIFRQRKGLDILKKNLRVFYTLRKTLNGKIFDCPKKVTERDYIYFPLHVDPEAATMVLADQFIDQVAVIESIAKNMPASMTLIVKEHVPMLGRRPKDFYERIKRIPDVKLVSPFADNFSLLKNASLTCVITSTAAWEAMMLGKPALIFGNTHFENVGAGFVKHENLSSDVGVSIKKAIKQTPVSDKKLIHYIASIMKKGVEFPIIDFWQSHECHHLDVAQKFAEKIIECYNYGVNYIKKDRKNE